MAFPKNSLFRRCVGLEFKQFNPAKREFADVELPLVSCGAYLKQTQDGILNTLDYDNNIVIVLKWLQVREDKKRQGIATQLLEHCEDVVKVRMIREKHHRTFHT